MGDAELTRWPGSPWPMLERGDLVNIRHGDFAGEFRVTDVSPGDDGGETYTLEPAGGTRGRRSETEPLEYHGEPSRRLGPVEAMAEAMGSAMTKAADDMRAMYWKVAPVARALGADSDYCNICENFPCLGNHPAGEGA